jgi:site-specific DNA-cytosine methylase
LAGSRRLRARQYFLPAKANPGDLANSHYTVYHRIIDAQSVVPQHRERIFLVGFKQRRALEFPAFPAQGSSSNPSLKPMSLTKMR